MFPSVILWLEQDNTSLYRRLKDGKIGKTVDIPENLMYNLYTFLNNPPPADLTGIFGNKMAGDRFNDLCRLMNYSTQPFYFLFGPLARNFASQIGTNYGINFVFSTIDNRDVTINDPDPFSKMETIFQKVYAKKRVKCDLALDIVNSRNCISRQWKIESKDSIVLEGDVVPLENNDLNIIQLRAEAIREFAKRMQWGLNNGNSLSEKYNFEMEE